MPYTSARYIVAIPGLGEMDAAAYQAGIGSRGGFQTRPYCQRDGEVWTFAGYDPVTAAAGSSSDPLEPKGYLSR
jgi:hypothetical protein